MRCAVLCCALLRCAVLRFAVLCCGALWCAVLCSAGCAVHPHVTLLRVGGACGAPCCHWLAVLGASNLQRPPPGPRALLSGKRGLRSSLRSGSPGGDRLCNRVQTAPHAGRKQGDESPEVFRAVLEQIAEALINAAAALLSPAAQVRLAGCGSRPQKSKAPLDAAAVGWLVGSNICKLVLAKTLCRLSLNMRGSTRQLALTLYYIDPGAVLLLFDNACRRSLDMRGSTRRLRSRCAKQWPLWAAST